MPLDGFTHAWHNQTTLHPVGLAAVVLLGLLSCLVSRRHALIPLLVMACFVAPAQRVVVAGLDFNLLRLMIAFGWARVVLRNEWRPIGTTPLDLAVIVWAAWGSAAYVLLHGSMSALVNRAGFCFDAIGMYCLFRVLVRDWADVVAFARAAAVIAVPVAACFLVEKSSGRNMFSVFGGVPEITIMRQGKLRCQGAFAHPIMAGCFWAALLPLVAGLLWRGWRDRLVGSVGLAAGLAILLLCASTTPLMLAALGFGAALVAPLRGAVRWIAAGGVGVLVLLHLLMQQPVWHLLARIDLAGGSTGWYRYLLIDEFISRIDEWALIGTRSTESWWIYGLGDLTNQFVVEGVRGGLPTLLLLLVVIGLAYAGVGQIDRRRRRRHRHARALPQDPRGRRHPAAPVWRRRRAESMMAWFIGISLFIHCCAFISVSYFGQAIMPWYLILAMIGSLASSPARRRPQRVAVRPLVSRGRPSDVRLSWRGVSSMPAPRRLWVPRPR